MGKKGFTIPEILIAVTIATVIIVGTVFALLQTVETMSLAKKRTEAYVAVSEAVMKFNRLRTSYREGHLISDTAEYDMLMLTNSGKTAGALVATVVADEEDPSYLKPVPLLQQPIYGKKVLAVREITASQISDILANTGSALNVSFSEDSLFNALDTERMNMVQYNSGTFTDMELGVYMADFPEFEGSPKSEYPLDSYPPIIVNVVF
jgi:prepilin-type N-terminal cleavage/methylation domain-containing protein